jgi:hypothetical protein
MAGRRQNPVKLDSGWGWSRRDKAALKDKNAEIMSIDRRRNTFSIAGEEIFKYDYC